MGWNMKKKKILLGLLLAASVLTLASCGDTEEETAQSSEAAQSSEVILLDDQITLNIENKVFDNNPITATASSLSGQKPTIEYKLKNEDDNKYTNIAPKAAGIYIARAKTNGNNQYNPASVTKEFIISTSDIITLNAENKVYDGNSLSVSATSLSGQTPTIEYKRIYEDDTKYSASAPIEIGKYMVRATTPGINEYTSGTTTKEIEISYELITDFSKYEGTESYVKVTTAKEFLDAIYDARMSYTTINDGIIYNDGYSPLDAIKTVRKNQANWDKFTNKGLYYKSGDEYIKIPAGTPWDPDDTIYTKELDYYEDSNQSTVNTYQTLEAESKIKVIEIDGDLDLGYNRIASLGAKQSYENWDQKNRLKGSTDIYCDPDIQAAGISKIKIANIDNLVIYSKNGAKLTHCGFSVESSKNVLFKNLEMDEIWMWEDSTSATPTSKIGDYDSFGWAYFKIALSEQIVIDHCTFGKSFDGQIDYSQPFYGSVGTYSKSPFGGSGNTNLIVSYCNFNAGDDDENGYIYKMMNRIETEYQIYASDKTAYTYSNKSCRYYFALRDAGLSFDDVFYGIAIPQKKAFLWGDENEYYLYNNNLTAIMYGCNIKNIEDRIPKVRGGIAYVINTKVDNTEYLPYVSKLKSVQSTVLSNSPKDKDGKNLYKLGAVSQAVLAGLNGRVYLESVDYQGVNSYIKNNEETSASDLEKYKIPTINGYYMVKNSRFGTYTGSITNNSNPFTSIQSGYISADGFKYKLQGKELDECPFSFNAYDLLGNGSLDGFFQANPSGTITSSHDWLKIDFDWFI